MRIKLDEYEFGDSFYFKNDPEQKEYLLVGLIIRKGMIMLELSYCGEVVEAYEIEISKEIDIVKKTKGD